MALSAELISRFAKLTTKEKTKQTESTAYGTVVTYNGKKHVRLDGSEFLTPVASTARYEEGERVSVLIKNHTATVTGNITSPAPRGEEVDDLQKEVGEFAIVLAGKVEVDDLLATNARVENLEVEDVTIKNTLKTAEADIDILKADNVEIENKLSANEASIEQLKAEDVKISGSLEAAEADIKTLQADNISIRGTLEAANADIDILKADNVEITGELDAAKASIETLQSEKATIEDLEATNAVINSLGTKYASIDFSNIGEAAISTLFTSSGIIKDLVVKDSHITGELVGVTIKGDIIEGGTVKADKLVVKGSDGLFYKLNTDGVNIGAEQTEYNSLNGSVITAKSITAEKVNVSDLVAFEATIGGFHITEDSIYSGAKASATNTTQGIFLGAANGEFAVGDYSNFLRYYKDSDGYYRLEISAASVRMGGSSKSVQEEIQEIRDEVTTNLRIESSRGTVFKNDSVSTVLSAVIYRGSQRITDMVTLRAAMGSSAYLQWKWQRLDETSFGVISASDTRLGNDGFTFTLSPNDVDTKVTFMCELITD